MTEKNTLSLWDSVCSPPKSATKEFSRSGGFKGTAINAVYLIKEATKLWGPIGGTWGFEVVEDKIIQGAPFLLDGHLCHEQVHVIRINLRHPDGVVSGYGQTTLVGRNKYGPFTDEEAPKKSLTDALTKALSWLGFAADIHMGIWDDNKYVNQKQEAPIIPATPKVELPAEEMKELEELASVLIDLVNEKREEDAKTHLHNQSLENEQKIALWNILPSNVRSALKKK